MLCGNTHEFSRVTQVYARVHRCVFLADIRGSFANIKVSFAQNPMDLSIHHQCFLSSVRLECMLECTGEFFGGYTGLFCEYTGLFCEYTGLFCEYTGLFCTRFYLPIHASWVFLVECIRVYRRVFVADT